MSELPSEIFDKNYIHLPLQEKVIESDEEWSMCGKWVLINPKLGISWIDEAWKKLQILLSNGTLVMLKASTAAMENAASEQKKKSLYHGNMIYPGTIICYTRPSIAQISKAAEEIRRVVDYESCMYYKINSITEKGINSANSRTSVSAYMHTYEGRLYRNCDGAWVLVEHSQGNQQGTTFSFDAEELLKSGIAELPSRSSKQNLSMKSDYPYEELEYSITTTCTMQEHGDGLTEADRLWIIGKNLIDRGDVKRVACQKDSEEAKIRFFVAGTPNYESLAKLCDIIREEANYRRFMYFIPSDLESYMYSPDGELYIFQSGRKRRVSYVRTHGFSGDFV